MSERKQKLSAVIFSRGAHNFVLEQIFAPLDRRGCWSCSSPSCRGRMGSLLQIHNQYNQNKSIRGQGHRVGATVNTVLLCCHSRRIEMLLDFFRKLALINIPCRPENLMFIKKVCERPVKKPVVHIMTNIRATCMLVKMTLAE